MRNKFMIQLDEPEPVEEEVYSVAPATSTGCEGGA